jgi:hypothetical protein
VLVGRLPTRSVSRVTASSKSPCSYGDSAAALTISLQGRTLTGAGVGAGIALAGRTGVRIVGGTIVNFMAGILTNASTDVEIKHATFRGNTDGIDLQAGSEAGIRVNFPATGNLVKENTVTANPAGIDFLANPVGGGGAAGNFFVENTISLNVCGLNGPMSANTFNENKLIGNTTDICG